MPRATASSRAATSAVASSSGRLGERFIGLFDGLEHHAGRGESVLEGSFDQAALRGVLDRLSDLGIELVSVNPIE